VTKLNYGIANIVIITITDKGKSYHPVKRFKEQSVSAA
jgi:hypothetical protein